MTRIVIMASLLAAGCYQAVPPQTPTPAAPIVVAAEFDSVWNAIIDTFADRNIAIATIDRSSGFIVAERLRVPRSDALLVASCGALSAVVQETPAAFVTYNVVARNVNEGTMLRVTARWVTENGAECSTRGVWEEAVQENIRIRATTGE